MSSIKVTVTNEYTLIGTGPATITVKNIGSGSLLLNENDTGVDATRDDTAIPMNRTAAANPGQFVQTAAVAIYARYNGPVGDNWAVTVDTSV